MVDLHLLQQLSDCRRDATDTLQFPGSILTFPAPNGLERIEAGDPQRHGIARWHPQLLRLAGLRDFTVEGRQTALLLGQEAFVQ